MSDGPAPPKVRLLDGEAYVSAADVLLAWDEAMDVADPFVFDEFINSLNEELR